MNAFLSRQRNIPVKSRSSFIMSDISLPAVPPNSETAIGSLLTAGERDVDVDLCFGNSEK